MTKVMTTITEAMKLYGKEMTKAWENGSIVNKKQIKSKVDYK